VLENEQALGRGEKCYWGVKQRTGYMSNEDKDAQKPKEIAVELRGEFDAMRFDYGRTERRVSFLFVLITSH
jgi:hypothetical protein